MATNIIPSADILTNALDAQQLRMKVITTNLANANTTKDVNGPYQRKMVTFQTMMDKKMGKTDSLDSPFLKNLTVGKIVTDPTPGTKIYSPSHPHADKDGMVEMPNVKMTTEMADMISASVAYGGCLTTLNTIKQMSQQAIAIGRY